jgi:hypothetical protein
LDPNLVQLGTYKNRRIKKYGKIKGEITSMGTGTYVVYVDLSRMFGQRVEEMNKSCQKCYNYHKRELNCKRKT